MATTLRASLPFLPSSSYQRIIKARNTQNHHNLPIQNNVSSISSLQVNHLIDELKTKNKTTQNLKIITNTQKSATINSNTVKEMYAIMEAVADRVEMHKNIGEQRNNWNHLLLSSVNGMITTAALMAGVGSFTGAGDSLLSLKISSTILYIASTGILVIMNKIQPSQLAEEQRNASRLFKQLHEELKTTIALEKFTQKEVENAMEKILALDKAYPLPLLGVMLDKFPKKVEPAVWWPKHAEPKSIRSRYANHNGWNENLQEEMKSVLGVLKRHDEEDYIRLAKIALNFNKFLAISGPLLTGLAAGGSAFLGFGTWPLFFATVCGALATVVNAVEHGGQVGMVFEIYRSSAGFFKLMEENIETALEDGENGEVFEAKVAMELGRSISELRDLAATNNSTEEFASKLF